MGKDYVKRGAVVQLLYEARNRNTGLTVQATVREPNGSGGYQTTGYDAGGLNINPVTLSEIGTSGAYTAEIPVTSVDGWHYAEIDSTGASGTKRVSIYKFRVAENSVQEIHNVVESIEGKVDDIQGVGFATGDDSLKAISDRQQDGLGATFNNSTDSQEAIRDAITALQSTVDNIESNVDAVIYIESFPELEIPDAGTTRYRVVIKNYGVDGMEDFSSAPTLAVTASGVDISATKLYDLRTAGSLDTSMNQVGGAGSGTYELFFEIASTDTEAHLEFVVTGTVGGETKTYQKNAERKLPLDSAGVAQESTLTEIKQKAAGTYNRETMSLEAAKEQRDDIAGASFVTGTMSLEAAKDQRDDMAGAGFATGSHSLVALAAELEELQRYGAGKAH